MATEPEEFTLHGRDLFGEAIKPPSRGVMTDRFVMPPFSVLNAREGAWQERKRAWLAFGIQSEIGRGGKDAAPGGSARPACDYSNRERGDGRGRALANG